MSFASECIGNFAEIITKKYCRFSGRARRREFWEYQLVVWILTTVISLIDGALKLQIDLPSETDPGILSSILGLLLLLPGLGVLVRRLHDIGKSAWWILIPILPIIGSIWLLILECKAGDKGPNNYGPDPKEETLLDTDPGDLPDAG
ncbi:MAG: DUF805 domain-containing protein [Abditibacteriota bacterium]|nr:DUF805 domain-containing protein [Abditibacteriota bacterium]